MSQSQPRIGHADIGHIALKLQWPFADECPGSGGHGLGNEIVAVKIITLESHKESAWLHAARIKSQAGDLGIGVLADFLAGQSGQECG